MQAARPIRGPHGGWQKQEIDALRQSIEAAEQSGESLRSVFDRMSRQLGRKPNSIRNFYYAKIKEAGAFAPNRGRAARGRRRLKRFPKKRWSGWWSRYSPRKRRA